MNKTELLGTQVEGRTVVRRGANDTSVPMVGAKKVKGHGGSADRLSRGVVMTIQRYLAQQYQENHENFGVYGPDDYPFKQEYNSLPSKDGMGYLINALNAVTKKLKAWDFVARANEVQTRHIGCNENAELFIYSNMSGGTIYRTVYVQSTNRGAFKIGPSTKRAGPISITNRWSWGSQHEHLSSEMVECLPSDWTTWIREAFSRCDKHYGDHERVKKIGQYEREITSIVESYIPSIQKELDQWNDPEWVASLVAQRVEKYTNEINDREDRLKAVRDNLMELKGGEEE